MASRSQFELNDDNNFETLNFRFENSAFDIPDGLLGSAYFNTVLNTLRVKDNSGWVSTLTSASVIDASLITIGTVPLARLAGITNAQLSATAGILSDQIAGLDAGKITGTFPLSLLNQGTTGQFLRGDGTYSNTLTGGLTIAGALAGATTGAFSGAVATGALTVTGAMAASGAVSGTTGTFSSNIRIATDSGGNFGLLGNVSNAGLTILTGGSDTSSTGASISLYGNSHAVYPGKLVLSPTGGNVADFLDGSAAVQLRISSTGLALLNQCRINYGAAGTTDAANNEIVGAVGGLRYNVASGLSHTLLVANTAALTLNSTSATFSGTLAATAATITTGSIQFLANNGGLLGSGSSNQMRIGSGSTGISSSGASIALNGNTTTTLQGYLWLYAGQVAGGRIRAIDETNTQQMEISSAGTTINKIILIDNTPATATSTGTEGQIAWDASGNLYLCPVANTWLKFTGATF